jgi:hypothetical protein
MYYNYYHHVCMKLRPIVGHDVFCPKRSTGEIKL